MTLANDSILVTPGSGATVATHLVASKELQVVVPADVNGHLVESAASYLFTVPPIAVGANKVMLDLFNATGSGLTLRLVTVLAYKEGSVAVTGVLAVKLSLTRTTAVGTGGTAMTLEGTTLTAPNICKMDPANAALHANITARAAPTGGGTAGAVLAQRQVFPEETNAASYGAPVDFLSGLSGHATQRLVVPENTGIRIVQGAVASVGSVGFEVLFQTV